MDKQILAKSDGTTLIKHSNDTANAVSSCILQIVSQEYLDKKSNLSKYIKNNLKLAALLHDIGKATNFFQLKLIKNGDLFEDEIKSIPFRHNEVGYAFLATWTNLSVDALKLIYWHHGISHNKVCAHTIGEILKNVTDEDIETMKSIVRELAPNILISKRNDKFIKTPSFYSNLKERRNDPEFLVALSCLQLADRFASGFDKTIEQMINKEIISDFKQPYSGLRYDTQVSISNNAKKTTFVNAPAGFGKTLTGILWSLKSNKKLIWACPRNDIADSVYTSIIKELKALGVNISVELYYGSEVQNKNNNDANFNSDIIVTNIDNFLKPSYESGSTYKNVSILNSDVIFDEYHELVSDAPLFALTCHLLKLRNSITKSNTMLLSASPIEFSNYWTDTQEEKDAITFLPGKNIHFPAAHDQKFKFNFTLDHKLNEIKNDSVFIINSISGAQELTKELGHDKLIHSKFTKEDRGFIFDEIYELYGKDSTTLKDRPGFIGTHIVQASLDVSFYELYEDILSPLSTIQRCGRCNRFGFNNHSIININMNSSKNNQSVTKILFDQKLTDKWYYYMRDNINKPITLNELYAIYNSYMVKYEDELDDYVGDRYKKSVEALENIFPKKYFLKAKNKDKDKKVMTAGNNKLRSSGPEIFYICKDDQTGEIVGPFSTPIYNYDKIDEQFYENGNTLKEANLMIEEIIKDKNSKFDYTKFINFKYTKKGGHTLANLRELGKSSESPYPAVNFRYNKILGVYNITKGINLD